MKRVIIANPNAGSGRVKREWTTIQREIEGSLGPAEVRFTECAGDGTRLVKESLREGTEQIIVVGGDGSVNEAVNGWFQEDGKAWNPEASLAIFPNGTGGDFARSIGLASGDRLDLFSRASVRDIDVGRVEYTSHGGRVQRCYFANISSFGSSAVICNNVNSMSRLGKVLGGKASYAAGTVKGLVAYRNRRVRLRIDDTYEEERIINTVAVANGRYFGGSMKVAPEALVDDGLFDIVVIGDVSLLDFVRSNGKLYRGEHLEEPGFSLMRGRKVVATPVGKSRDVLLETDGETPGRLPVTYEVVPKALKLVAPWADAEAVTF